MRILAVCSVLVVAVMISPAYAVNCDKNPTHPNCSSPPGPSTSIDSILVDRNVQEIRILGSGLTGAGATIAGTSIPSDPASDDSSLRLPFGSELAATVTGAGNYVLSVEGMDYAIYIDGAIVDANFSGCPCGDFNTQLAAESLSDPAPDCLEVSNEIVSDYLASSYPVDFTNPPFYLIGAAFVAGNPGSSVCQMVKFGAGGSVDYLLREHVNATQQSACAAVMLADQRICGQAAP